MLELAARANVSFSQSGEVLLFNFQPRSQGFSLILFWKPDASRRDPENKVAPQVFLQIFGLNLTFSLFQMISRIPH